MEVKRDILWRVYLGFLGMVLFALLVLGRVIYIQQIQGKSWKEMARRQQQRLDTLEAERGTIYSEDGSMLSTSIPYFDIYIDFLADGLRENKGRLFRENLDSLSDCLSRLLPGSSREFKRTLEQGYRSKSRYFLLQRNLTFDQFRQLRTFPLVRLGKNKSGFIAEVKSKRLNPFQLLANRTIGLSREYISSEGKIKNTNVGLEDTYDSLLRGEKGQRLLKYMAGGVYAPVEGSEIEPENGKDLVTTLDVNIQDIAENALMKMLVENECEYGTCIVMEVKTGKIKAIANLGKRPDGSYWEDLNYAIRASEPGSTFKLATLLALLEDKHVNLADKVNLEGGKWQINRRTVYDSEEHGLQEVTVEQAFEHSSNVGMAKLTMAHYARDPGQYIAHLRKLRLDKISGIDINGETSPVIKNPASRTWSATSLPWMSFGYEVLISPLQTLMLYNAVANNGRMMKPYLVNEIQENGRSLKQMHPRVVEEKICDEETLVLLRKCLEGVCQVPGGTGYNLFRGAEYPVAGKTGTALVANGNRGYSDHIYQSSFAGYFPANDPQYSCIVVIRNKPFAKKYYGASVAGPVFREIADKLVALQSIRKEIPSLVDSLHEKSYQYAGESRGLRNIMATLKIPYVDSAGKNTWGSVGSDGGSTVLLTRIIQNGKMPDLSGLGLKDALFLMEQLNLKVSVQGRGKVWQQSIVPGTGVRDGQTVSIQLN